MKAWNVWHQCAFLTIAFTSLLSLLCKAQSDDDGNANRPFLCYAWCLAKCGSLADCETSCAKYKEKDFCPTSACWSACSDLAAGALLDPGLFLRTVMKLNATHVTIPKPDPYSILVSWEPIPNVSYYVLQTKTEPLSSWISRQKLISASSSDSENLQEVISKSSLCESSEFRVVPIYAAGIALPSISAKVNGADVDNLLILPDNLTISGIFVEDASVVAYVNFQDPIGWKRDDYTLEVDFIDTRIGCTMDYKGFRTVSINPSNLNQIVFKVPVKCCENDSNPCTQRSGYEGQIIVRKVRSQCTKEDGYVSANVHLTRKVINFEDYCHFLENGTVSCSGEKPKPPICTYNCDMIYFPESFDPPVVSCSGNVLNINITWQLHAFNQNPCAIDHYLTNFGYAVNATPTFAFLAQIESGRQQVVAKNVTSAIVTLPNPRRATNLFGFQACAIFADGADSDINFRHMSRTFFELPTNACSDASSKMRS